MGQEDDLRALGKIMDLMRGLSIVILIIHIYWFFYQGIKVIGLNLQFVDTFLLKIAKTTPFFSTFNFTKILALIFLALSCLGTKGVKTEKINWSMILVCLVTGLLLYFGSFWITKIQLPIDTLMALYTFVLSIGYILLLMTGVWMSRLLKNNLMNDVFNVENESFMQETRLIENDSSVNLPTKFYYKKKWNDGWINIVNPYRATMVLGTPGSGKSYAVINNYIKQQIEKGFTMYLYDFKFPDLSVIAYNHLAKHAEAYGEVEPKFYIINLDDPRRSHRCNPLSPKYMTDIADAYESASTIMLNLNKTWIKKQGEFFVESPINLFTAIIWFLRIYDNGRFCTLPHAIELLNSDYQNLFKILMDYSELDNYMVPFMNAYEGGAQEQLQGQLASAQIPTGRMISPSLYWVMTGDDFTLDLNNPKEPKILVVGNNPDRQSIYSAALGLYNARIVKLINKKYMYFTKEDGTKEKLRTFKSSVIMDEFPTIYFRGIDNLIATARSNRVAVCLGFQDFSQLKRDYGDDEAKAIQNLMANLFSGQVTGETADTISKRFGKVLQKRASQNISRNDTSTTVSTQMESLIPASKISTLTQGTFVGVVADDIGQPIEQKFFHCKIIVDADKVKREEAAYIKEMPNILDFEGLPLSDEEAEIAIKANYNKIKEDVRNIVALELYRIAEKEKEESNDEGENQNQEEESNS